MPFFLRLLSLALVLTGLATGQPRVEGTTVIFIFNGPADSSVSLVGDFNGWSPASDPMRIGPEGTWTARRMISSGLYQYKFLVDGKAYLLDSLNPASIENYDGSSRNSIFAVTEEGEIQLTSTFTPASNPGDLYEPKEDRKPVYLNIIWHQHQPLYVDPETDQLRGPWVRTHATKDYYDMAAMLRGYPGIHCTINLTSSLLHQLQHYYVGRLAPFVDGKRNSMDVVGFLARWKGKTDPWIDLALKPTVDFDETDRKHIEANAWNAFGISEVMIARFPAYAALKAKVGKAPLTSDEMRQAKFWFYLAHFDPDFLRGPVSLNDGSICDLSDLVRETDEGKFLLTREITEEDCARMVVESYKVMSNVIGLHRSMLLSSDFSHGQIEVITTPYYHPILPLVFDSDFAKVGQPQSVLPNRFSFPDDARAHIKKAVRFYKDLFGRPPLGMWPGEGAVAQQILPLFQEEGIRWTASDVQVLQRSKPEKQPNTSPFRFPAVEGGGDESSVVLVFRDTELSDRIGFKYQTYEPEVAAEDFVKSILARRPQKNEGDVLLTVILDGENAWEWYRNDNDAKGFLNALYRKLTKLGDLGMVVTTTTSEYIQGNPARKIPPHPVSGLTEMKWLHPGSWINGNYDTWIGEAEENVAWEALLRTRQDLGHSGIAPPEPNAVVPPEGSSEWYRYMAWEEMYAAEGSDWFWWYGSDQSAPSGDKPFDEAFRIHLQNVYKFARSGGGTMRERTFPPIIGEHQQASGQGTMAQSRPVRVVFRCDASAEVVDSLIFITGNINELGSWTPNAVRMFDDGTHGDERADDKIWSIEIEIPRGGEVLYKYTNSGPRGHWTPGEEFSGQNRRLVVPENPPEVLVVSDVFGKRTAE